MLGYFWLWNYWQIAIYVLAVVALVTAITGHCYLYTLIDWSTLGKKIEKPQTQ